MKTWVALIIFAGLLAPAGLPQNGAPASTGQAAPRRRRLTVMKSRTSR